MRLDLLEICHEALNRRAPDAALALDPTVPTLEHLAVAWAPLLQVDALRLAPGWTLGPIEDGGFAVTGTTAVLGLSELRATIRFFLSETPDGQRLECLLEPLDLPEYWTLAIAYPGASEAFAPTLVNELAFHELTLRYCSYDFADSVGESTSIPDPTPAGWHKLREGVNMKGSLTVESEVWRHAERLGVNAGPIAVTGAVSAYGDVGLVLELDHAFEGAEFHPIPESDVAASIEGLRIVCGIEPFSPVGRSVVLEGRLGGEHLGLGITLALSPGADSAVLTAHFDKPPSFEQVGEALGLGYLVDHLPPGLDLAGDVTLELLSAELALSGDAAPSIRELTVAFGTKADWQVVEGLIEVRPRLQFGVRWDPDGNSETAGEVVADWKLGSTTLELWAASDGEVSAHMPVGQTLDVGALFEKLFGDSLDPPAFELLDLDLIGNLRSQTFELDLEAGEVWSFEVGGAELAITDIEIQARYDGRAFIGHLAGAVTIAGWLARVDAELTDRMSVEITLPSVPLGDLVDAFLRALGIASDMHSIELKDVDLRLTPAASEYSLSGQSDSPIALVGGLEATVRSFAAARAAGASSGKLEVDLAFGDEHSLPLVASYDEAGDTGRRTLTGGPATGPIAVGDLLRKLESLVGLDYPLPTDGIVVHGLFMRLDESTTAGMLVAGACELRHGAAADAELYGSLSVVAVKPAAEGAGWDCIATAVLGLDVDLTHLPLVGETIASLVGRARVTDLKLDVASKDLAANEVGALIEALPPGSARPPGGARTRGPHLHAGLDLGGLVLPLTVPALPAEGAPAPPTPVAPSDPGAAPAPPPRAADRTKWIDVKKTLGPVTLDRVGVRYREEQLAFLLDAHLRLGTIELGLIGLGAESPLGHFDPSFTLDGLTLGYQSGPLTLSGGFARVAADTYSGTARVDAGDWSLTALGEYGPARDAQGRLTGQTSLFVYAILNRPLGGPPAFSVKGVAAGLGYNSRVNVPPVERVHEFSLVRAALPGAAPLGQSASPSDVLAGMRNDVSPQAGSQWLAAGVRFSSFELVQSFALAVVSLGDGFKVDLVGLSQLSVPPEAGKSPIAFVELAIKASLDPGHGVFSIEGRLTPQSYVLDRRCKLSGGFAFYLWFGDSEHAGDFVFTVGGYHPQFQPPAHYPLVPRLALAWQISSALAVKGTAYFAVTPKALMAGGSYELVWSAGDLRAWFSMTVDFLLYWKPFYYRAHVGASIGVEFTVDLLFTSITVTLHVGASLDLHGPDFAGTVHIDLSVVSFTIAFGASDAGPRKIPWGEFRTSFLPSTAGAKVSTVAASSGVLRDLDPAAQTHGLRWMLNPQTFELGVSSPVPSTAVYFNDAKRADASRPAIGVVPVGVGRERFSSTMRVWLERLDHHDEGAGWQPYHGAVRVSDQTRDLPAALWGEPGGDLPSVRDTSLVHGAFVGLRVTPGEAHAAVTHDADIAALEYAVHDRRHFDWSGGFAPVEPVGAAVDEGALEVTVGGSVVTSRDFVLSALGDPGQRARRRDVIAALVDDGVLAVTPGEDITRLTRTTELASWPVVEPLGGAA